MYLYVSSQSFLIETKFPALCVPCIPKSPSLSFDLISHRPIDYSAQLHCSNPSLSCYANQPCLPISTSLPPVLIHHVKVDICIALYATCCTFTSIVQRATAWGVFTVLTPVPAYPTTCPSSRPILQCVGSCQSRGCLQNRVRRHDEFARCEDDRHIHVSFSFNLSVTAVIFVMCVAKRNKSLLGMSRNKYNF